MRMAKFYHADLGPKRRARARDKFVSTGSDCALAGRSCSRDNRHQMRGFSLQVTDTLAALDPRQWDALVAGQPLLSHAFLHALHETGCASPSTGWAPRYLLLRQNATLVGAMPLYLKGHSYGEYVFDWSWADAYRRHGRRYYPKLLAAIPFTPATGPRLLAAGRQARQHLLDGAMKLMADERVSSLHILFPQADDAAQCGESGLLMRDSLQFHWRNPGYRDFSDFLSTLNHDKRKKVRQERQRMVNEGIRFRRAAGSDISAADWAFFYRCYVDTYRRHGSTPYLSLTFFERIGATMPANIVLVIGSREGKSICAAPDVFDSGR